MHEISSRFSAASISQFFFHFSRFCIPLFFSEIFRRTVFERSNSPFFADSRGLFFFFLFFATHAISSRVQRSRSIVCAQKCDLNCGGSYVGTYTYMYRPGFFAPAVRLLVKIHLITEHYRAEGVMIVALARNRNRFGREREELARSERLTCR